MLGLPSLPPELKSIFPYLQRADELRAKEPIMAYWCAYYAAQIGISLKARDMPSRTFLAGLLSVLEQIKTDIGPHDAVDIENVSTAYVENFALRVFSMADNEDRKGEATRSTAKKFLAAANFLEVLNIFPKPEISDNDEKIRYAKWKAADIAKAFREGRKPAPGPADAPAPIESSSAIEENFAFEPVPGAPKTTPRISPPAPSLPSTSTKRISPPPQMDPADIARANRSPIHRHGVNADVGGGEGDPGTWSTAATPGSVGIGAGGFHYQEQPPAKTHASPRKSRLNKAWVSEDLEPRPRKAVHFTPFVQGGLSTTMVSPPLSPDPTLAPLPESSGSEGSHSPPQGRRATPSPPRLPPDLPSVAQPTLHIPNLGANSWEPSVPPLHPQPLPHFVAPIPPPLVPVFPYISPPPHPPTPPLELTPSIIAKAQKHCRFAISALDYEDAEQARKELRVALGLLGG